MNIWKIASRWHGNGHHQFSILDIFLKHQVAFFHPDGGCDPSAIQLGDLIAVSDGYQIVAVAKAASLPGKMIHLPGFHLSERDHERIDHCINEVEGLKIHWLPDTLLFGDKTIEHQVRKRFCSINQEEVRQKVIDVWNQADAKATQNAFQIDARTSTLENLLTGNRTELYLIPIFQRTYSWKDTEVERFLGDLITAFRKNESLFVGTMQLSGQRVLSTRGSGTFFQEVIDGQQRLTTSLLILKALHLLLPAHPEINALMQNRSWLETRVSSGQQQQSLDAAIHTESLTEQGQTGLNPYLDNLHQIYRTLTNAVHKPQESNGLDEESKALPLNLEKFGQHFLKKLQFVVIETEAGLSRTIQIFNTINTTGLDLNGGDLFKVRAFEYLTDVHHQPESCFAEISALYEEIERTNATQKRIVTSIQEILSIYQKIIIARHGLPIALTRANTETFYERLFDSLLQIKAWDGYTTALSLDRDKNGQPLIRLGDLHRLLQVRLAASETWNAPGSMSWESRLAHHLIEWSRYSSYWVLTLMVDYCYADEIKQYPDLRDQFVQALAKLCVVYSVINAKQINEVHSFFANLSTKMFDREGSPQRESLPGIIAQIQTKVDHKQSTFESELSGNLAGYATAKNLVCRLLEALHKEELEDLDSIFSGGYDIEHIQAYNDHDVGQREQIWNDWGTLLNSIGNLMLLEFDVNRSISNQPFHFKRKQYLKSRFNIAKQIASLDVPEWTLSTAKQKLESDTARLSQFLFNTSNSLT